MKITFECREIEVEECTTPFVSEEGVDMFVWGIPNRAVKRVVSALLPDTAKRECPVVAIDGAWSHCAHIPKKQMRRMTWIDLAKWVQAKPGNGWITSMGCVRFDPISLYPSEFENVADARVKIFSDYNVNNARPAEIEVDE